MEQEMVLVFRKGGNEKKGFEWPNVECFISKIRKEEHNELEKHFTV